MEKNKRDLLLDIVANTLRSKEYWLEQGLNEEEAIDKATDYAMSKFQENIEPEEIPQCIPIFEEITAITVAFAQRFREFASKLEEKYA